MTWRTTTLRRSFAARITARSSRRRAGRAATSPRCRPIRTLRTSTQQPVLPKRRITDTTSEVCQIVRVWHLRGTQRRRPAPCPAQAVSNRILGHPHSSPSPTLRGGKGEQPASLLPSCGGRAGWGLALCDEFQPTRIHRPRRMVSAHYWLPYYNERKPGYERLVFGAWGGGEKRMSEQVCGNCGKVNPESESILHGLRSRAVWRAYGAQHSALEHSGDAPAAVALGDGFL